MLQAFQDALQNTALITWVRESPSVLVYPSVLAAHAFGMAFLVGLTVVIALRTLGFAPDLPMAPLNKFFPLIWLGFWVNAVSGVILFSLTPADFLTNGDFYIKMFGVLCAVVTARSLRQSLFGEPASVDKKPVTAKSKKLAVTLLIFWAIAIAGGRLTAYHLYIRLETVVALFIVTALFFAAYGIGRRMGLGTS